MNSIAKSYSLLNLNLAIAVKVLSISTRLQTLSRINIDVLNLLI